MSGGGGGGARLVSLSQVLYHTYNGLSRQTAAKQAFHVSTDSNADLGTGKAKGSTLAAPSLHALIDTEGGLRFGMLRLWGSCSAAC